MSERLSGFVKTADVTLRLAVTFITTFGAAGCATPVATGLNRSPQAQETQISVPSTITANKTIPAIQPSLTPEPTNLPTSTPVRQKQPSPTLAAEPISPTPKASGTSNEVTPTPLNPLRLNDGDIFNGFLATLKTRKAGGVAAYIYRDEDGKRKFVAGWTMLCDDKDGRIPGAIAQGVVEDTRFVGANMKEQISAELVQGGPKKGLLTGQFIPGDFPSCAGEKLTLEATRMDASGISTLGQSWLKAYADGSMPGMFGDDPIRAIQDLESKAKIKIPIPSAK